VAAPVVVNAMPTWPMVEFKADVVRVGARLSPQLSTSPNKLATHTLPGPVYAIGRFELHIQVACSSKTALKSVLEFYHEVFASRPAIGFPWHFATFEVEI
jgi:hypothetical protein